MNHNRQSKSISTVAIIPTGGAGRRMESNRPKQYLSLGGLPIIAVTLEVFQNCDAIDGIILVVPAMDVGYCKEKIVRHFKLTKVIKVIAGGEKRQDSVRLGIEASEGLFDLVLIHDGVRPLINKDIINRVIQATINYGSAIPALPATDTIKRISHHKKVVQTFDRQNIFMVQTPQGFHYQDILTAHQTALKNKEDATDDSSLVEKLGVPVKVINGSQTNIKITTIHDLIFARHLLSLNDKTLRNIKSELY